MDATAVIDSYIDNIAARLPRRLRNDVGVELRTLLLEQLDSAAAERGIAADEALAIEVAQGFGRPEEVAVRYNPRGFQLIEPEHVPVFIKVSAPFVAVQWALTLPPVFHGTKTVGAWWTTWGIGAFAWVGVMVIWFGLATWVRRRSPMGSNDAVRPWTHHFFWIPVAEDWHPVDRGAAERRAELGALPLGVVLTILLFAPSWLLGFTGADVAWTEYDGQFREHLLPALLVLMVVRLVLCAVAGFNATWRMKLEAVRMVLWVGFTGLLLWVAVGWKIFANPMTNAMFKVWLTVFLLVNVIQIVVKLRRMATRVRVPNLTA